MKNPKKNILKKYIINKKHTFKNIHINIVTKSDNIEKNSNINNYFRTILSIKNKYNKPLSNYHFPNVMNVDSFVDHIDKINEHILSVTINNTSLQW